MAFESSFFSKAGQIERLKNTGATLKAALTGGKVYAFTGSEKTNKALSAGASNPFTTAAVGAIVAGPAAAGSAAAAAFRGLPATGKVVAVLGAPVALGAVVSNPGSLGSASKLPAELTQFGSDLGTLATDPSKENLIELAQNSPVILSGLGLATAVTAGRGVAGTVATIQNTRAIRESTEVAAIPTSFAGVPAVSSTTPALQGTPASEPITRPTQVLGREASGTVSRRRRVSRVPSTVVQNRVHVEVLNRKTYIRRR